MAEEAIVDTEELREQDRFLPIANISRIMKKSLPDNAKIAKDAKETVQVCGILLCVKVSSPSPRGWSFSILRKLEYIYIKRQQQQQLKREKRKDVVVFPYYIRLRSTSYTRIIRVFTYYYV